MRVLFIILTAFSTLASAQQSDTFPITRVTGRYILEKQNVTKGASCNDQISIMISPDDVLWISGLQIPIKVATQSSTTLKVITDVEGTKETVELNRLKDPKKIQLIHLLEKNGTSMRAECEYKVSKY